MRDVYVLQALIGSVITVLSLTIISLDIVWVEYRFITYWLFPLVGGLANVVAAWRGIRRHS